MAYELTWEPDGVTIRLTGFVSAMEFLRAVEAVQSSPASCEVQFIINDFSGIAGHGLTAEVFDRLACLYGDAHGIAGQCRIFFVTHDESLARLVIKYSVDGQMGSHEVAIATTLDQARHCLANRPVPGRSSHKDGYQSHLAF